MPPLQEAGVRLGIDGFHLATQRSQRSTAKLAQHIAVAELPTRTVGTELSTQRTILGFQRGQRTQGPFHRDAETSREILHDERAMSAGIPGDQRLEWVEHRFGERVR